MRLALIYLKSILLFVHDAAQWVSCTPCICLLRIDFYCCEIVHEIREDHAPFNP